MDPSTSHQLADHPCHTCRRKRVQCDRSQPHCAKCTSKGIECLGYGKFLLWTGSVASRGKLAGQSSSAAACNTKPLPTKTQRACGEVRAPEDSHDGARAVYHAQDPESNTRVLSRTCSFRPLVDPLFQDKSGSQRRYFDYFSRRVCKDLIGHDFSDRNPFRNLLPLATAHPLLQQVIVAASAAHMCNQVRRWVASNSFQTHEASYPILMDALVAKHKALQLMSSAIQNIDSVGTDIVLASALFLVNVELLESGKNSWKPHLEGAARILSLIQPLALFDESLKDYIMSDCIVYSILSLTFNPSAPGLQSYLKSCQVLPILEKTANSYLCCPPELLNVLLLASRLLDTAPDEFTSDGVVVSTGAALLEQARNVDLDAWASRLHDQDTIRSRFLAGSAHQLAACLYVLQVVPILVGAMDDEDFQALVDGLHEVLSQMPDEDPNFKATAWPSFVLGATTESQERRSWVMDRLKRMTIVFPWGFVYSAIDTLQVLWGLEGQKCSGSWVQTLRQLDVNFLIV